MKFQIVRSARMVDIPVPTAPLALYVQRALKLQMMVVKYVKLENLGVMALLALNVQLAITLMVGLTVLNRKKLMGQQ